jgi:hypothetical protein
VRDEIMYLGVNWLEVSEVDLESYLPALVTCMHRATKKIRIDGRDRAGQKQRKAIAMRAYETF